MLTPRLHPDWPVAETIDGVSVHRFSVPPFGGRERTTTLMLASFVHVHGLIRRFAPDVLNTHYLLPTGIAGQWWASRLGVPNVLTLVGMDVYDPHYRPARMFRRMMRWATARADAVACLSTFVRDRVAQEYPPRPGAPFTVIPHGVDTKRFHPGAAASEVRRRYGVRSDEKLVLTVQRLYARKGVHIFIEAAAIVARACPDARFVVAGDGPERAALERLTEARRLRDRVTFTGRVPDDTLPALYAAADVFAFHSFHEGLGIVLLEAMAAGRPVVTTDAGGTVDVVHDGVNGLVVPPGDAGAFANAVIRVLRDPPLRASLAGKGREIAETRFDWDLVTAAYLDVFRAVERGTRSERAR